VTSYRIGHESSAEVTRTAGSCPRRSVPSLRDSRRFLRFTQGLRPGLIYAAPERGLAVAAGTIRLYLSFSVGIDQGVFVSD
jgi:hypothetical protein